MSDDIINLLIEKLMEMQPGLEADFFLQIEKQLRTELGGSKAYVKKLKPSAVDIVQRFDGRNAKAVAKELGVSRATVYRAIVRQKQFGNDLKNISFLADLRREN